MRDHPQPNGPSYVDRIDGREKALHLFSDGDWWVLWHHPDGQWVTLSKVTERDLGNVSWTFVEALRQDEGSSVEILSDNPDFDGAPSAINVCGEWTAWNDRRFHGDTVLSCLIQAYKARLQVAGKA